MLFEPVDTLGIEVVGRLVEKQNVGILQQQTTESHTAALASTQGCHVLVFGRTAQRVHSPLEVVVEIPRIARVKFFLQLCLTVDEFVHLVGVFEHFRVGKRLVDAFVFRQQVEHRLHSLLYDLFNSLCRVEFRVLLQITDTIARRKYHFALILLIYTGNYLQKRRFTRTIKTDYADFRTIEK